MLLTVSRSLRRGSAVLDEMAGPRDGHASRQQHESEVGLRVDVVRVRRVAELAQ